MAEVKKKKGGGRREGREKDRYRMRRRHGSTYEIDI
jgi:hypothetical protein